MIIGLDIETWRQGTTIDFFRDEIALIQLAFPDGNIIVEKSITPQIRDIIEDTNNMLIIQNAPFDLTFLLRNNLNPINIYDTLMVERILTAGKNFSCSLDSIVERRLNKHLNKSIRDTFHGKKILTDDQINYAKEDVQYLHEIRAQQLQDIERLGLETIAGIENQLTPVIAGMQFHGMGFSLPLWKTTKKEIYPKFRASYLSFLKYAHCDAYTTDLFGIDTFPVNLNSHRTVFNLLQGAQIHIKDLKERTLRLYLRDYPKAEIIKDLLDYKKYSKQLSWNFGDYLHPDTNRIHSNFNQLGAVTGRIISSDPNLQQIPKAKLFRRLFQASPRHILIICDLSQIELRILAKLADEHEMIKIFQQGGDIHLAMAQKIYHDNTISRNDDRRDIAKQQNFASIYGAGAETFAYRTGIPVEEAKKIQADFFREFKNIDRWVEREIEQAKTRGYSESILGRKRWFSEEALQNPSIDNTLRNNPVQTSSADIMKILLIELYRRLSPSAKIILQVYDEVLIECPQEDAYEVALMTKDIMETTCADLLYPVPINAEIKIGRSWAGEDEGDF